MHRRPPVLHRLKHAFVAATIAFLLAAAACSGTNVSELSAPTAVRCQTGFAAPPSAFPASGGRINATVTAARECSWSAAADSSWLQLSPASGQGESEIILTAAANQQPTSRTAAVVVNDYRVTVRQDASPCAFALSRSDARIDSRGGRFGVTLTAQQNCTWSATSSDAWIRVLKQAGTGPGEVELEAQANSGDQRTAKVTVAGQLFTVVQEKYSRLDDAGPSPSPSPSPLPTPSPSPRPTPSPSPLPSPSPRPTPLPTPTPIPTPTPTPAPPGHDDDDDDKGKDKDRDKDKDKDKDKDRDRR
jgi:hypothetical protein